MLTLNILKQQLWQHQFQILNKANKAINKKLEHQIYKIYIGVDTNANIVNIINPKSLNIIVIHIQLIIVVIAITIKNIIV